jgi:integrase
MPRKVNVRWDERENSWRADVGHRGKNGRRKAKYFREIPNTPKGRRVAVEACDAWIAQRDRVEMQAVEAAADPSLFDGLSEPYLAHLEERVAKGTMEARSWRSCNDRIARLLAFQPVDGPFAGIAMRDRKLSTITDDDGQAWLDFLHESGLSPSRIRGLLSAVKTMFGWGAASVSGRKPKRILPANPFLDLKPPTVPKPVRELPTTREAAKFFRAARNAFEPFPLECGRCMGCKRARRKNRCRRSHTPKAVHYRVLLVLLRLQIYAGTRPSELCRATWGPTPRHPDIGWNPRAWKDPRTMCALRDAETRDPIRDPRTHHVLMDPESGHWWGLLTVWGKTTRKTGQLRKIAVPPTLTRSIERIRGSGLHAKYIFPRRNRGGAGCWDVEGVDHRVRKWRLAAGLGEHFKLYNFRHRMYTRAIHAAGLTTDQAGSVGGTAGPTVASTYLQPVSADLFEHASDIARAARSS